MMNLLGGSKAVLLWEASVLSSCQLPKENSISSVIWSLLFQDQSSHLDRAWKAWRGTAATGFAAGVCHV